LAFFLALTIKGACKVTKAEDSELKSQDTQEPAAETKGDRTTRKRRVRPAASETADETVSESFATLESSSIRMTVEEVAVNVFAAIIAEKHRMNRMGGFDHAARQAFEAADAFELARISREQGFETSKGTFKRSRREAEPAVDAATSAERDLRGTLISELPERCDLDYGIARILIEGGIETVGAALTIMAGDGLCSEIASLTEDDEARVKLAIELVREQVGS